MYNLKVSLLLAGGSAEESGPRVAGEEFQGREVGYAHVPGQLVGQEVAVLFSLDQGIPVPHSRHISAFVLLLCSLKNALVVLTPLRIEFSLDNSTIINRFVLEDYLTLAGQHFLQSPSLREFSLASVLCDFSSGELDIDFPHLSDPFYGQQQVVSAVECSALGQDIVVPFALHQESQHLCVFFGLGLFDQVHLTFSVCTVFVQSADEVPVLVNDNAMVRTVISFDNQSGFIGQHGLLPLFRFFRLLFLVLEDKVAVIQLQWFFGLRRDVPIDGVKVFAADGYFGPFCSLEQSKSQVLVANTRRTIANQRPHLLIITNNHIQFLS